MSTDYPESKGTELLKSSQWYSRHLSCLLSLAVLQRHNQPSKSSTWTVCSASAPPTTSITIFQKRRITCPQVSLTNFMGHESALEQIENAFLENIYLSRNMYFSSCRLYVPSVRFVPSIYFPPCNLALIQIENCSGTSTSGKVTTQKQTSVETKILCWQNYSKCKIKH